LTLAEKIKKDLEQAIRQNDKARRDALRLILASVKNAEIDLQKTLDDSDIFGILAKEAKKRQESIEAFEQGNRQDLIAQEKVELTLISEYLPEQMSRDDIIAMTRKIIEDIGATDARDKGKVMAQLMPQTKGRAEGKEVSDIVSDILNNLQC